MKKELTVLTVAIAIAFPALVVVAAAELRACSDVSHKVERLDKHCALMHSALDSIDHQLLSSKEVVISAAKLAWQDLLPENFRVLRPCVIQDDRLFEMCTSDQNGDCIHNSIVTIKDAWIP